MILDHVLSCQLSSGRQQMSSLFIVTFDCSSFLNKFEYLLNWSQKYKKRSMKRLVWCYQLQPYKQTVNNLNIYLASWFNSYHLHPFPASLNVLYNCYLYLRQHLVSSAAPPGGRSSRAHCAASARCCAWVIHVSDVWQNLAMERTIFRKGLFNRTLKNQTAS